MTMTITTIAIGVSIMGANIGGIIATSTTIMTTIKSAKPRLVPGFLFD